MHAVGLLLYVRPKHFWTWTWTWTWLQVCN